MAMEFKSIDVNNEDEGKFIQAFQSFGWKLKSSQRVFNQSTTPTAAISYENYTYIHSETETIDFTKLVFERDKNIESYSHLVELEQEFFDLNQDVSGGKPYIPPHVTNMESWAKHFEPDLRTSAERKRMHIFFGILLVLTLFSLVVLTETISEHNAFIIMYVLLLFLGFVIVMWRMTAKLSKSIALRKAIKNPSSVYRARLEHLYNDVIQAVIEYEENIDRMREILHEAQYLSK